MVRYLAHKWYLRSRHDVTQCCRHDKVQAMVLRRDDSRSEWYGFVYFRFALSEADTRRELGLPDADEDAGTSVLTPKFPGPLYSYKELRRQSPSYMYAWDERVWQKEKHHYWSDRRPLTVY